MSITRACLHGTMAVVVAYAPILLDWHIGLQMLAAAAVFASSAASYWMIDRSTAMMKEANELISQKIEARK